MAAFDLTFLKVGPVQTLGKGSNKSAAINYLDGSPAVVNLDAMRVAFEPSGYNDPDATRVDIVWQPGPSTQDMLSALDEWVVQQAVKHSVQWFGKARSVESIHEAYVPCAKKSDRYPASFRAKMNIGPPAAVRVWDGERQPCELQTPLQGWFTEARIHLRSVWFMPGGQFGLVLECTDLKLVHHEGEAQLLAPYPF